MKGSPSIQFYPSDWLRDPGLRACSLQARGLWIDMMSFMHEGYPYGHLKLAEKDILPPILARMVGADLVVVEQCLVELEGAGVFSRTPSGTIFSRRMVKDQALREKRAQYGHLSSTNPSVPRKKDTFKDTLPPSLPPSLGGSPSSSSSSSSSPSLKKEKIAIPPSAVELAFEEFWERYPKRNGKRIGKPVALAKFKKLSTEDRCLVLKAVKNYASSQMVLNGIGIKDAQRWLRNGKDDEPWRDWTEPEQPHTTLQNGHGVTTTCRRQVRKTPGDPFLKPCGQPVVPGKQQCAGCLAEFEARANRPKEVTL